MSGQQIVHVVVVASVPNQNGDGSFSALADVTELDIEFSRLADFRSAVVDFSAGDVIVNGTLHSRE